MDKVRLGVLDPDHHVFERRVQRPTFEATFRVGEIESERAVKSPIERQGLPINLVSKPRKAVRLHVVPTIRTREGPLWATYSLAGDTDRTKAENALPQCLCPRSTEGIGGTC